MNRLRVFQRAQQRQEDRDALMELAQAIVRLEEERKLEQERVVRRIEMLPGMVYRARG